MDDSVMSIPPRISIVMPTYNSARHLASTVDSVVAQTYQDWELVLADDESRDDTPRISKRIEATDHRIRAVSASHGGPAAARNAGLRRTDSRSEFVIFLDSDDTWESNALAVLLQVLEDNPACPAAHGLARATDLSGQQYEGDDLADTMRRRTALQGRCFVQLPLDAPTSFEAMIVGNCLVTPGTCLIRRSALAAIGEFEPSMSVAEDWDLGLRLSRLGDIAFVNKVILNWRRHPDSLANTGHQWRSAGLLGHRRAATCRDNTIDQRKAAMYMLRVEYRNQAAESIRSLASGNFRKAAGSSWYALRILATYARCVFVPAKRGTRVGDELDHVLETNAPAFWPANTTEG
jgi:glycosyltransferase involved in cell wall biosynthesis